MSTLAMPVMVLNKSWTPIRITTVMDALCDMFSGKASAVDEEYAVYDFDSWADLKVHENDPFIATATSQIKVPEVIVLKEYDKTPQSTVVFSRMNIFSRDHYTCQYCGCQPGVKELTIDHVLPKARGGKTSWENCVLACWGCNSAKANKTPEEAGMRLRSQPVKPDYSPRLAIRRVRNTPKTWAKFVSDAYWNTELKD